MADIFIAYARADLAAVRNIEALLKEHGLSVWWDTSLLAGENIIEVIERELSAAKIVLVLWSKVSVNSQWVISEAMAAARAKKLLPIIIDSSLDFKDIPDFLSTIQTLDFRRAVGPVALVTAIKSFQANYKEPPKPNYENVPARKTFISYPSEIEDVAIRCVKYLESSGCTCWISFRDVDPGEDHREQIVAAIEKCSFLLCLYSADANDSYDVATELLIARQEKKKRLVLNIDHSKPNGRIRYELASVQWIEFDQAQPEASFAKIALRAQVL